MMFSLTNHFACNIVFKFYSDISQKCQSMITFHVPWPYIIIWKGQQNVAQSNETMKLSRVIAFHFCCNALKCFLKETWIVNFNGLFWGLQTFEDLWCYLWTRYWQLRIVIDVRHITLSKYEKYLFYISLKLKNGIDMYLVKFVKKGP